MREFADRFNHPAAALDHAARGSGYARALDDAAAALRNAPQPLP